MNEDKKVGVFNINLGLLIFSDKTNNGVVGYCAVKVDTSTNNFGGFNIGSELPSDWPNHPVWLPEDIVRTSPVYGIGISDKFTSHTIASVDLSLMSFEFDELKIVSRHEPCSFCAADEGKKQTPEDPYAVILEKIKSLRHDYNLKVLEKAFGDVSDSQDTSEDSEDASERDKCTCKHCACGEEKPSESNHGPAIPIPRVVKVTTIDSRLIQDLLETSRLLSSIHK